MLDLTSYGSHALQSTLSPQMISVLLFFATKQLKSELNLGIIHHTFRQHGKLSAPKLYIYVSLSAFHVSFSILTYVFVSNPTSLELCSMKQLFPSSFVSKFHSFGFFKIPHVRLPRQRHKWPYLTLLHSLHRLPKVRALSSCTFWGCFQCNFF